MGNCQYLFEPTSAFILDTNDSKTQVTNYNESFDFLRTSTTNQILKHNYCSLSYKQKYEQAEWVSYELKKRYVRSHDFDRHYFIENPKVKTEQLTGVIIKNKVMIKNIYVQPARGI